ncbi:hypothetical protein [Myxococcus sp. RHSTA-1-4]|uniref:hypothetical protein n=1 Tax=Myxococcus sp. RHSTA-1-4 TaxID=2874601 RepID=UPI001CBA817D|nr:hypothetical protein [Myxococcus sp. RHSTA-1-4]MBZ4422027.1 hypothetical protein [Myxococcus sp. RHSTA-1-4]
MRLELLGATGAMWLVTTFSTVNDWEEPTAPPHATYADGGSFPGNGRVPIVLPTMVPSNADGSTVPGVRVPLCTLTNVPKLAESSAGFPSPLALDSGGRLRVAVESTSGTAQSVYVATTGVGTSLLRLDSNQRLRVTEESGLVKLASGTLTRESGGLSEELLGAALDTSAYRFLCLRIGNVTFTGGTGPTATPALRSVTPSTLGGAAGDLTLHSYLGGTSSAGGAAEVMVGQWLINTAVTGSTRGYCGRILRAQCVVTFGGTPTGYSVPWELWGEP